MVKMIDVDLSKVIKINNDYYPLLTKYKVGNEPLMSSDTGRTVQTGEMKGSLVGNFPKLELTFDIPEEPTADEKAWVLKLWKTLIYDKNIKVEYFNTGFNEMKTGEFYATTLELETISGGIVEPFTIRLIANKRLAQ